MNDLALRKFYKVMIVLVVEVLAAFILVWIFDIAGIYGLFLYAFYFFEVLLINLIGGTVVYKIIKDTYFIRFVIALIATIISFPLVWVLSTEMIAKFLFR